jgi:hypothetical protein
MSGFRPTSRGPGCRRARKSHETSAATARAAMARLPTGAETSGIGSENVGARGGDAMRDQWQQTSFISNDDRTAQRVEAEADTGIIAGEH